MNIGEISKPTVDRARIKKKLDVKPSEPIVPSKKVSDFVELSEESRQKYEKDTQSQNASKNRPLLGEKNEHISQQEHSIDVEV